MVSKYRWPAIGCAATTAVLAGFLIFFQFILYTGYRSNDFTAASIGPVTTTCIEAASLGQIDSLGIKTDSWSCSTSSKDALAEILSANVHALYDQHTNGAAYTGDAKAAYDSVISATQGTDTGFSLTRAGIYDALSVIDTLSTVDCAALYPGATEQATVAPVAVTVVCDDELPTPNNAPTVTVDTDKLYTHCLHQFSLGRSWPSANSFGIPVVGQEAKPLIIPLSAVNSTTPWQARQRVLTGTRWGMSTVVYVFMTLLSSYFIMDSSILLLAELTRVDSYFAQNAITAGSSKSMKEGMFTMLATFQAKRNFRWAISLILFIIELLLWILLIQVPWGFGASYGRPICETEGADHWITPFQRVTIGGWKKDYDSQYLEALIIILHLVIIVALPISLLFERGSGNAGQRGRTGTGTLQGYTGVAVGSLRSAWWFVALSVGALSIYIGQALALFAFGYYWSEGVTMNKWNEVSVGSILYDHVLALLYSPVYLTITIGLSLGSVTGRWLLAGLSCTSFTIFLLWMAIAFGAFVPLFFVSAYWIFFDVDSGQGKMDCAATFGDEGNTFARTSCDIRLYSYIVGVSFLILSVAGPTVLGLLDYTRVCCLPRRRAWVPASVSMPDYWRSLVTPQNPDYRGTATANENGSLSTQPLVVTGNGYRSATTEHFNWELKDNKVALTVPSSQVGNV